MSNIYSFKDKRRKLNGIKSDTSDSDREEFWRYPYEEALKKSYPLGQWSIGSLDDLLSLHRNILRRIIESTNTKIFIDALKGFPEEHFDVADLILSNITAEACTMLLDGLYNAVVSDKDCANAQEELLSITREMYSTVEQESWDELMGLLPDSELLPSPDLSLLQSFDHSNFDALEGAIRYPLLIYTFGDGWGESVAKLIFPKWEMVAVESFIQDSERGKAVFEWQTDISRRALTTVVQQHVARDNLQK
jgi:hypothetical protein